MKLTFTFPGKKGFDGDLPSPPADRRFVALPLPRLTGSSPAPAPSPQPPGPLHWRRESSVPPPLTPTPPRGVRDTRFRAHLTRQRVERPPNDHGSVVARTASRHRSRSSSSHGLIRNARRTSSLDTDGERSETSIEGISMEPCAETAFR